MHYISVTDEFPLNSKHASEAKKRSNDAVAAGKECERVVSNWTQHKPKWKRSCTKKELNLNNDGKTCMCKHLWSVDMKMLLDHMTEVSREECRFGSLPEMCPNSPVQFGALTSESFSERIMSAANLLVDAHRLCFGDCMIDKLIALRMNKKFMDRIRNKPVFSTMQFDNMDANKRIKV